MFRKISLFITIFVFFLIPSSSKAYTEESINDFKIDIVIDESSALHFTETIEYDFTAYADDKHGIYRNIPFRYQSDNGEYIITNYEIESVQDQTGEDYEYQLYEEYNDFVLRIGSEDKTVSGTKIYIIKYTIDRGILFHDDLDYDEFYWNLVGTEWMIPINNVQASIEFPKNFESDDFETECYTGYLGSQDQDCLISKETNSKYVIETTAALPAYHGLTSIITFPHEIIEEPAEIGTNISYPYWGQVEHENMDYDTPHTFYMAEGEYLFRFHRWGFVDKEEKVSVKSGDNKDLDVKLDRQAWFIFLQYIPWFLIPLTIGGLYWIWTKRGRDIDSGKTIVPEYSAPKGITPLEAGTIDKEYFKNKFISAEIIKFAVEGYLRIHYKSKKDYTLEKLKPADGKLEAYETIIFDNIFSYAKDNKIDISDLKNKFYTKLPKIKKAVWTNVLDEKFFTRDPRISMAIYLVLGLLTLLVIGIGLGIAYALVFLTPSFIVLGVSTGVYLIVLAFISRQRSKIGSEYNRKIKGLKLYMNVAEKERIKFHNAPEKTPKHFEALLPYAMVLEVEKQWAEQFKDIYSEPPDWYTGQSFHTFSAIALTNALSKATSSISTNIASRPSSSGSGFSSGGFSSGGGFSGGGGGGGGGGSW